MWMNILNNSRNVLTKGQEEVKKEEVDAKQGGGFDSKITLANTLCSFSRLAWQSETHLSLFNSLRKRGGV